MPRPKDPSSYPSQYGRLLTSVAENQKEIVVPCPGEKEAAGLRGELYAFRLAARRNREAAERLGYNPDVLDSVMIVARGSDLVLSLRDERETGKWIDRALGDALPRDDDAATRSLEAILQKAQSY